MATVFVHKPSPPFTYLAKQSQLPFSHVSTDGGAAVQTVLSTETLAQAVREGASTARLLYTL
jgi:hypothetical protein